LPGATGIDEIEIAMGSGPIALSPIHPNSSRDRARVWMQVDRPLSRHRDDGLEHQAIRARSVEFRSTIEFKKREAQNPLGSPPAQMGLAGDSKTEVRDPCAPTIR
jgi:hypothetical protein